MVSNLKVAVLGGRGHLGQRIVQHLSKRHSVIAVGRDDVDLTNGYEVRRWLEANRFNIIINCATTGAKSWSSGNQSHDDTRNNVDVFMNFAMNQDCFSKFINIGSGAEFDLTTDIDRVDESAIYHRRPADSYGWSKNLIARLCQSKENFYTLRLFGCFAPGEPDFRVMPKILRCAEQGQTFVMDHDRYFDYISINDFLTVLEYVMCNRTSPYIRDINCVYPDKRLLSNVLKKFAELRGIDPSIIEVGDKLGLNYTGSADRLMGFNLDLEGLEQGLKNYEVWNN